MLARRTGLDPEEATAWRAAADRMYVPWDERLRINPQDDSFLDKKRWDFAGTPEDHYPLLLHYHPLNLYRAQVIKQADTVLAMFLLGDEFTPEQKKRNFDYYDPLTTHDSSLSVCIQSIVANELGYARKALEYFNFAVTMDPPTSRRPDARRAYRVYRRLVDGTGVRFRGDAGPWRRHLLPATLAG